ncbi:MAG TPA: hypothetical protein VMZ30_04125 [Pyrinomonadaceae bacterium]|nr:hypothetical protein [Pyrinomonadaceae bacterium]
MNKLLPVLGLVLLGAATCISQEKVVRRIPVSEHSYYVANVIPALKKLVAQSGKSKKNHFYVGRVEMLESGYHSVLVYWKENQALVLWEPGRGSNPQGYPDSKFDLADSRRYWELDKDVVPTLDDVGGSSFLITRKDARRWVRDCVSHGARYVINREAQSNKAL